MFDTFDVPVMSGSGGDAPDQDDVDSLGAAIDDARRILDHQIDWAMQSDESAEKLLRYNLLVTAAFTTLLAYAVSTGSGDDFVNILTVSGTAAAVTSILVSMSNLVGNVYGGFGDAPYLRLENVSVNLDDGALEIDGDPSDVDDVDFDEIELEDDFRTKMLFDFQRGIRHNNRESIYRLLLYRRSVYLLVVAIVLYGLGAAWGIKWGRNESGFHWIPPDFAPLSGLGLASIFVPLVGAIVLVSSVYWWWDMNRRRADEGRMRYDHYHPRTEKWLYRKLNPVREKVFREERTDERDETSADGSTDGDDPEPSAGSERDDADPPDAGTATESLGSDRATDDADRDRERASEEG